VLVNADRRVENSCFVTNPRWSFGDGMEVTMQKLIKNSPVVLKRIMAMLFAFVFVFTTAILPTNVVFADEGG
jgi:hypothetical protein